LDAGTLARIFEPLPSEDQGAGLANVYRFFRQIGGDMIMTSAPGGGTSVSIYMPSSGRIIPEPEAAIATEAAPPAAQEAPVEESSSEEAVAPSIGTVLVVEDEEGVRSLIKKILQRNGYSILEAADDDTAVKLTLTHEGRIDLLVTDVVMPQTSGLSLADKLKEVRPELKVLFVSGFTDDATITSGLLPPGTAFLQKPFTLSSLLTKVQDVMGLP
jgi:CheY-like chemotaxis protein